MVISPSPGAGENRCLSSAAGQRRSKFSLPPTFCSFLPSVYWLRPTHGGGQSALLSLMIQTLTACGSTLTDTLRIIVDQIPEHPMIQSS